MNGNLVAFPLPMLTFLLAVVAAGFVARVDTGVRQSNLLLAGFFAVIAVGSFLVGLRFGYGISGLIPVQRVMPLFAGPCLYLAFLGLSVGRQRRRRMMGLHLGLAIAISLISILISAHVGYLDVLIGISYVFYAVALLLLWVKGANHLSYARIELAASLHRWMLAASGLLVLFVIADTAIAVSFALEQRESALAMLSVGAVVMIVLLVVTIFIISASRSRVPMVPDPVEERTNNPLEMRARALLEESQLYLDTDLSIDRLAKRLRVPSRELSQAINQSCGMNVSQYVNDFRLEHAVELLKQCEKSVAEVMEASGFLTRSNFYRAFQGKFGLSPAAFRDRARAEGQNAASGNND